MLNRNQKAISRCGGAVLAVALTLLAPGPAAAQVSGRVSGAITDPSGAAIPAATVRLALSGGTVAATQSASSEGLFNFIGLAANTYDLRVEAAGFAPLNVAGVKVDTARETSLGAIVLQPATLTQSVDVVASGNAVQTANAEIAATVTNEQVRRLPQLNRNILALIATQAGVGANGRTGTAVNGLRTSFANVTLDGVNIQDNLFRENSLDFQPNLLLIDQVGELSVSTSNTPSSAGGGAAQIAFTTPSGTNRFHGAAYWYNRNNALAANGFFENRDGIGLPFLNQNQLGGSFSGPLIRNKLFFFTNYEAFRRRQQSAQQRTILTDSARQGIFTYTNAAGVTQRTNILQLAGYQIDPFVQTLIGELPAASAINNFRTGDSAEGLLRNTGGYSFLQRNNRDRNNVTGKADYYINDRHAIYGTYAWNSDFLDRPAINQLTFTPTPSVFNDNTIQFFSAGWRSTWSSNFTNELRGGMNIAPGDFLRGVPQDPFYIAAATRTNSLLFSNPRQTYQPQGRSTRNWTLSDNASWIKGSHTVSFGFQANHAYVNSYDFITTVPTYQVGLGTRNGVTSAMLPGASGNDLVQANYLLSTLAGLFDQVTQRFNVASTDSGFVPNQERRRIFTMATLAGYAQDSWRLNRVLTLNLGVRYEYTTRVNETRNLALLPVLRNNDPAATLLSNSTLDFAGKGIGRPWYNADGNNFAPQASLAWNVRGNGKTAIRMGYSLNFVNDNHIATLQNSPDTNDGLSSDVLLSNITGTASRPTPVPTPSFRVPRTFADNYALNATAPFGLVDPNLRTPYVQQWNFSIQQQLGGGVLELRYLGNKATKQFRAFDLNQVNPSVGGFLDDFRRAYSNGALALAATGRFDARFDAAIPGSERLPVFDSLPSAGLLNNPTVSNLIQTQQAGDLARTYQQFGLNGPLNFFPNPLAFGTNLLTNYSNASWNALQIDYSRRFSRGYSYQVNYTWSKSLSDAAGDSQVNFEPFLDNRNGAIERAPTAFDLRHAVKGNFVLDLPFGKNRHFLNSGRIVNAVAGGWSVSGITTWQSGFPFGIRSQRATLNRSGNRSIQNTATTSLAGEALDRAVGFYMTGNGPFIIDRSAIAADGRGVGPDGRAPFDGQVFFNPGAGGLGALQRRMFQGPAYFNFDFGVQKTVALFEGHTLEFRMESTNFLNNVMFDTTITPGQVPVVDYNVNSQTFGRITNQANTPRRIQFGLYYRF